MSADKVLSQLQRPTSVDQRLRILRDLVEFWHGPIEPRDGMSDGELASMPLPRPLHWWYRWAGRRTEVMSGQNILFDPADLILRQGRLCFYADRQGAYQWSTLLQGDDPPVYGRYDRTESWQQERIALSEHLILACLFEASCRAPSRASAAWLDEQQLFEIVRHLPPVTIAPWRWLGMQFFAGDGAFMWAAENTDLDGNKGWSVSIGARTAQSLQFLKPNLDERWVCVAV